MVMIAGVLDMRAAQAWGRHSDVLEIARGGATVHLVTDPILTGFRVVLGLATVLEPRAFRSGTT